MALCLPIYERHIAKYPAGSCQPIYGMSSQQDPHHKLTQHYDTHHHPHSPPRWARRLPSLIMSSCHTPVDSVWPSRAVFNTGIMPFSAVNYSLWWTCSEWYVLVKGPMKRLTQSKVIGCPLNSITLAFFNFPQM